MISFINHLKQSISIIFYIVLIIILFIISAAVFNKPILAKGLTAFVLLTMPAILIHIDYYRINRKTIIIIDCIEKSLKINSVNYSFHDIKSIDFFTSDLKESPNFFLFGGYKFAEITMSDDKTYVITTLLINNLESELKKIAKDKIKTYYKFLPFTN